MQYFVPLHTLSKARHILLLVSVLLSFFISQVSRAENHGLETVELAPIVVFGIRNPDGSYSQMVEIAWQDSNDRTIVRQQDGSYTANSMTNAYSMMAFLGALGRPTLNLDLAYAVNSVSMTAEGSSTLKTLIEALEYFYEGVNLELTPILQSTKQVARQTMQRRLEIVQKAIERNELISLEVMSPKTAIGSAKKGAGSETWRIKIRRAA